MRRPSQIWSAFGVLVLVALFALMFLTHQALQLRSDRKVEQENFERMRSESNLLSRIHLSLNRLDLKLFPLITQESGRAVWFYDESFGKNEAADDFQRLATRLSSAGFYADSIRVHFQLNGDGTTIAKLPATANDPPIAGASADSHAKAIDQTQSDWADHLASIVGYQTMKERLPRPISNIEDAVQFNQDAFVTLEHRSQILRQNLLEETDSGNKVNLSQQLDYNGRLMAQSQLDQANVSNNLFSNNQAVASFSAGDEIWVGNVTPIWIKEELFLVRSVAFRDDLVIQGAWLDWPKLKSGLKQEIADLFPDAEFIPGELLSRGGSDGIAFSETLPTQSPAMSGSYDLTAMPIRFRIDVKRQVDQQVASFLAVTSQSIGISSAIAATWFGFVIGVIALWGLLHGSILLSERRASFVSAVTHELRTPLTTFRMYAEMLSEDMVPPEKRNQYLLTLRREADRLSLLVENVLQYAKLEKQADRLMSESMIVGDLFDRFRARFEQRASDANADLQWDLSASIAGQSIQTLSTQVEQILFNLLDNACKYGLNANRKIVVGCRDGDDDAIRFYVRDFGDGVAQEDQVRMFEPFIKSNSRDTISDTGNSAATNSGVGLGLSLCRKMAASIDATLRYEAMTPGAEFSLKVNRE